MIARLDAEIPGGASFVLIRRERTGGTLVAFERLMVREMTGRGFHAVRRANEADLALIYHLRCTVEWPSARTIDFDPILGIPRGRVSGSEIKGRPVSRLSVSLVDLRPTRRGEESVSLWAANASTRDDHCAQGLGAEWLVPQIFKRLGASTKGAESLKGSPPETPRDTP